MPTSVAVSTGLTTAAVLAYTQMEQVHCDWLSWIGLGAKPVCLLGTIALLTFQDPYAAIRAEIAKIIDDNSAGPLIVRLA